jgi:hypothetical protein
MKKLNITPGEAAHYEQRFQCTVSGMRIMSTGDAPVGYIPNEHDADLYMDAHNTYHATQMLPSQMAERIKALEDGLRKLMDEINPVNYPAKKWDDPSNDILLRGIGSRTMPSEEAVRFAYRALLTPPINEAHGHLLSNPE